MFSKILIPHIKRPNIVHSFARRLHHGIESIDHCAESTAVEVQIKMPWGHLAGKWWGPQNVRPIVGLHGWLDNAGTFDTLAPLLPKHIGFLSIDLPGHGFSSRLPDGLVYHSIDNVAVIRNIMKEYNWDKVSIMAHSMSSIIGYLFAGLFPNKIDMLIGLDALKPHVRPLEKVYSTITKRFESFLIADERNRSNKEPPSYTYEECVNKLHLGAMQSVDRDKCSYLINRNIRKSAKYPGKFFFATDNRMKYSNYGTFFQELNLYVGQKIKCPYLFIKATNSSYYEDEKYFHEAIEILKQNPDFHFHRVEGKHHVHLNEPHKVSGIIGDFINTYRPPENSVEKAKL